MHIFRIDKIGLPGVKELKVDGLVKWSEFKMDDPMKLNDSNVGGLRI